MKIFIKDPSEIRNLTKEYEDYSVKIKNKPYQKNWVKIAKVKGKLNSKALQNSKIKYWITVILTLGLAVLFDFAKEWKKEYRSGIRKKIVYVEKSHAYAIKKFNKLFKKQIEPTLEPLPIVPLEQKQKGILQPEFGPTHIPNLEGENPPFDVEEEPIHIKAQANEIQIGQIEQEHERKDDLEKGGDKIIIEQDIKEFVEKMPQPLSEEDYLEKLKNKELRLAQIPSRFHTHAICKEAIDQDPEMFMEIILNRDDPLLSDEQYLELKRKVLDQKNAEYLQKIKDYKLDLNSIPRHWRTYEMCKESVEQDAEMIRLIHFPNPLLIEDQYKELVVKAIFKKSLVAKYLGDIVEKIPLVKNYLSILEKAKHGEGVYLLNLNKRFHTRELLELSLSARKYGQGRIHNLAYFPEHMKTQNICEKAVIANGLNIIDVPKEFLNKELYKKAICPNIVPEDIKLKNKNQEPQFFTDREAFRSIPKEALDQDLCDHAFERDNEKDMYLNIQCPNPALRPYQIYEDIPNQFKRKEWVEKVMTHQPQLFKMIPKDHLTIIHWLQAMEKFNTLFNKSVHDQTPLNLLKDFLDSIPKEKLPGLKWNILEFLDKKLKINDIESVKNREDLEKHFVEYLI